MPYNKLSTTKIARAIGCHPNTVRMYEQWGFLPSPPRSPAGYRLYTPFHLEQMRLAWVALNSPWPGRLIRRSVVALVRLAATGDLPAALAAAHQHLALVQAELAHSEAAVDLLAHWLEGRLVEPGQPPLQICQAAALLQVSVDMLRNWEANGLLRAQRDPHNRYRLYGPDEIARLRVIRMLRSAGYSSMAILRMLLQLEPGPDREPHGSTPAAQLLPDTEFLRRALDTPAPDEEIMTAADRWLTTLHDQHQRAHQMIALLQARLASPETDG